MRPEIVVADKKGRIHSLKHLEGAGMKGGYFFRLSLKDLIRLPYGSELFMLPDRAPVGYDPKNSEFTALEDLRAVAAFISPGFTIGYNSAYLELNRPKVLPLLRMKHHSANEVVVLSFGPQPRPGNRLIALNAFASSDIM